MAKLITREKAQDLARKAQVLEAKLARNLYDVFNKGEPLDKLREFACRCMKTMIDGGEELFKKGAKEENRLAVWRKIDPAGIGGTPDYGKFCKYYDNEKKSPTFNASDVSDIIRLMGAWVEQEGQAAPGLDGKDRPVVDEHGMPVLGKDRKQLVSSPPKETAWGKPMSESHQIWEAFRAKVPETFSVTDLGKRLPSPGPWDKKEVERVWADAKKGPKERFENVKVEGVRTHGRTLETVDAVRDRSSFAKEAQKKLPEDLGHIDLRDDKTLVAGAQLKRAQLNSNVLKLDRLFGLVILCDISGTTADSTVTVEVMGQGLLNELYYLLPVATIVHNLHHSVLEVALALAGNGAIDYDVGFYTTLLPKIPPGKTAASKLYNDILGILQNAEAEAQREGLHFLLYYGAGLQEAKTDGKAQPAPQAQQVQNDARLAGGLLLDEKEAINLAGLNLLNANWLLSKAPGELSNYPRIAEISDLFGKYLHWSPLQKPL